MSPAETEHGKVALKFARALVTGDIEAANCLVSSAVKDDLEAEYNEMTEYGDGPVTFIEVMNEMENWPDKRESDIGWAYVALAGEGFSEAVAVVVSNVDGNNKITEIEWGRP